MKKILLSLTVATLMASPAAIAQNLRVDGVDGSFKTFQDAVNAIESEGTIVVLRDFTAVPAKKADNKNENAALLVGDKKITVKGEGHNINFATFFMFNLLDVKGSLTVDNLTLTYTADKPSNRGAINVGRGSLFLDNVTIKNLDVDSKYSVISLSNSNSNIPAVVFDNVKLEKCSTTANAEVLLANNNLTVAGECTFSLFVNNVNKNNERVNFAPSAGKNLSGIISLSFANAEEGVVAVRNCADSKPFAFKKKKLVLVNEGDKLIISKK